LTAAVACAKALREISGLHVEIKWPNDLMVSGKKLGGILTEMKSRGGNIVFAVVGIGINLNSSAGDFPPELWATATSIKVETGKEIPKTVTISRLLEEIGFWYDMLTKGEGDRILDEWRHLSSILGKSVRITAGNEILEGIAEALDGAGRLIVRLPSGSQKVISAGDVTMVR
jgi:BirA family biotin operon repressor/biotin-[acetyl-CoA-carboxylase] ligase